MLRMLKAGYAPGNVYSVVEWVVKISPEYPDDAVELIKHCSPTRTPSNGPIWASKLLCAQSFRQGRLAEIRKRASASSP